LANLIAKHVAESVSGLTAVDCPEAFVDETRQPVFDKVVQAKGDVDHFEEAFT
jgi:hypothetical protein